MFRGDTLNHEKIREAALLAPSYSLPASMRVRVRSWRVLGEYAEKDMTPVG